MKKLIIILFIALACVDCVCAQVKKNAGSMEKILEMSKLGLMHDVLKSIAGSWNFQDKKLVFVKGTLVPSSRYDDRFFDVEITGGKLKLPVANGVKEDNYKSFQLEGYDNVKKAFVTISVNNHIGSDIEQQTGTFDPEKKELTYEWESELVPGQKETNRRVITIIDTSHYTEKYYVFRNGTFQFVRELDYSR